MLCYDWSIEFRRGAYYRVLLFGDVAPVAWALSHCTLRRGRKWGGGFSSRAVCDRGFARSDSALTLPLQPG